MRGRADQLSEEFSAVTVDSTIPASGIRLDVVQLHVYSDGDGEPPSPEPASR